MEKLQKTVSYLTLPVDRYNNGNNLVFVYTLYLGCHARIHSNFADTISITSIPTLVW
ncbi:hypothetical protein CPS_1070 [Colwellia psychrerythraea 34H]|uniref:Uncharacterized protein n=1 Tax=Colwellia psychrerythraea (strain 34H / ATCC BAA-681) TaxID=167879 RepID=Q487F1_COLP3|nr:hypothetical protein CPS_1070 [Colwellia psychrerythraea 34H]